MPETDKLFPDYQLLSWLPDETFFSLVSRHHQLLGHVTSAQSCQLMFGSARAGVHHDLPNSLGAFAQRTNALLGEVDPIARERTLLKFYAAFLNYCDLCRNRWVNTAAPQDEAKHWCSPTPTHRLQGATWRDARSSGRF